MLAKSVATVPCPGQIRLQMTAVLLAVAFGMVGELRGLGETVAPKVDFNFQIRPILADRCFKCHGPDEKARKGKLRLDLAENAYALRDPEKNTRAIVPSHPEQ